MVDWEKSQSSVDFLRLHQLHGGQSGHMERLKLPELKRVSHGWMVFVKYSGNKGKNATSLVRVFFIIIIIIIFFFRKNLSISRRCFCLASNQIASMSAHLLSRCTGSDWLRTGRVNCSLVAGSISGQSGIFPTPRRFFFYYFEPNLLLRA